jgi:hypothetical protein
MRSRLGLFVLLVASVAAPLTTRANERHDADATLARASSPAIQRNACIDAAMRLSDASTSTEDRRASYRAIAAFARSRNLIVERAWCLRNARNVANYAPKAKPFAVAIETLLQEMLSSKSVDDRIVAARAAWGDKIPQTGRLLARNARPGQPAAVRIASFQNLMWPMLSDVDTGGPNATYASAIGRGLSDSDDSVVVAALGAAAALYQAGADSILLRYVHNANPVIRAGAIKALDSRFVSTHANATIVRIGRRDRDSRVREAASDVMLL